MTFSSIGRSACFSAGFCVLTLSWGCSSSPAAGASVSTPDAASEAGNVVGDAGADAPPPVNTADASPDSGPTRDPGFTLAVEASTAYASTGADTLLAVTITRDVGFDDAVELAFQSPDARVHGATVVAAPLDTRATITVHVDPGAPLGLESVNIIGRASAKSQTVAVPFTVWPTPGSLDPGFGTAGILNLGTSIEAWDLASTPDGALLVFANDASTYSLVILRVGPDGTLDSTFGKGGIVTYGIGESIYQVTGAVRSDGVIVAAVSCGLQLDLLRFDAKGALDTSFGSGGLFQGRSGALESVAGMAWDASGALVLGAGSHVTVPKETPQQYEMRRVLGDGTADASFGTAGRLLVPPSAYSQATSFARAPDGTLLIGGSDGMLRFSAQGIADPTWTGQTPTFPGEEEQMVVQPDGKVLTFVQDGTSGERSIARLAVNGALDPTFGTGGLAPVDSFARGGIVLQSDGKIIHLTDQTTSLTIVRLLSTGATDQGFGANGASLLFNQAYQLKKALRAVQQPNRAVALLVTVANVPMVARIVP